MQYPGHGVIDPSVAKTAVCFVGHRWDEEYIDDPANQEKTAGEEPQDASQRFSKIEAMGTGEPENPKQVANECRVGWRGLRNRRRRVGAGRILMRHRGGGLHGMRGLRG